jgi:arylsulfatase A-like enzyme
MIVFVVQSFVAVADAPAGARLVLFETAPAARASTEALAPVLGLDGGATGPAAEPTAQDLDSLARVLAQDSRVAGPAEPATRLLLVTIDALRHDAELPQMEARIGDRCTKPTRAYSTNNETTFAVYSLFASRFPSQGVFTPIGPYSAPVDDPAPRLPALLADAGFATMALAFHNRFDPRLGLTTGFADVWTTAATPEAIFAVAGVDTTDRAIAWTRGRTPPWMLWVHYYDPHEPYRIPDPAPPGLTPRRAYLGEVELTDREIARFFDALGPTLDETAIVVTADHGEAFGEHGVFFHSTDLFDEQIRVPMWVCPPRSWSRAPPQAVASLVDVAPTMLDFAGIPRPDSFMGRSLLVPADGDVPAFAESIVGRRLQAAVAPPWKLVRYPGGDVRLLFDLDRDPGERDDRGGVDDTELARMTALLDTWSALVARDG